MTPDSTGTDQTTADLVAAAVRTVPGVADLHPGVLGQIGTLLPGRRVDGVRIRSDVTEIHVSATLGTPLTALADAVMTVVRPLTGTRVDIVIEDVVPPQPSFDFTPTSQENPS